MNTKEWLALVHATVVRIEEITATKGVEYRRDSDDQFENFKRAGDELGISPFAVLHIYLNKHLDAIRFWIRNHSSMVAGDVKFSEPIEGRIDDAIVYLLLLKGMVIEQQRRSAMLFPADGPIVPIPPDIARGIDKNRGIKW